jgi:hypothetical protein
LKIFYDTHLKGCGISQALLLNVKLAWNWLAMTNALDYYYLSQQKVVWYKPSCLAAMTKALAYYYLSQQKVLWYKPRAYH